MRRFVQESIEANNQVQYLGMDGYGMPADGALPGYVTCGSMRESFANNPAAEASSHRSSNGSSASASSSAAVSAHGIPMEPINMIVKRIYKENANIANSCAFVKDYLGFR